MGAKIIVLGFSTALLLFAAGIESHQSSVLSSFPVGQAVANPIGPWGNLTALGIVAVVCVFVITKMVPGLHEKFVTQSDVFAKALINQSEAFANSLRTQSEVFSKSLTQQSESFATSAASSHKSYTDLINVMHERWHADISNLANAVTGLRVHCATKTGEPDIPTNPNGNPKV